MILVLRIRGCPCAVVSDSLTVPPFHRSCCPPVLLSCYDEDMYSSTVTLFPQLGEQTVDETAQHRTAPHSTAPHLTTLLTRIPLTQTPFCRIPSHGTGRSSAPFTSRSRPGWPATALWKQAGQSWEKYEGLKLET